MHQVTARVNLTALKHNLNIVKELAPESRVVSVIKANAYGHGITAVAKALNKSDAFAVARMDEALLLREQGITKTIFLLEGVYERDCYSLCSKHNLIPAIHCLQQFQWLQHSFNTNKLSGLSYWLKLDTGMHRLGLSSEQLHSILEVLESHPELVRPEGIMSHFSCADEISSPVNKQQLELFMQLSEVSFKIQRSMANSAALISFPDSHFDWVRPGIMLYGISPFETQTEISTSQQPALHPVMTLESELIAIKTLSREDCIGYGATWCCPEDMTIGVVGIGYGDGYPRHARSGTPVRIRGINVPLVGRVSMDMITIDLQVLYQRSITPIIGDKVTLWGDGLPVERVAQQSDTIAYELLCQITQRVNIEYE